MHVSVHALLRFVERNYKVDVGYERALYRSKWKIPNHVDVSDTKILAWIRNKYPGMIDRAEDDIKFLTKGKLSTFVDDGVKYVIREMNVITVHYC